MKENMLKKEDELKNMLLENEQAKQLMSKEILPTGAAKGAYEAKEEIEGWDDGDLSIDPFEF